MKREKKSVDFLVSDLIKWIVLWYKGISPKWTICPPSCFNSCFAQRWWLMMAVQSANVAKFISTKYFLFFFYFYFVSILMYPFRPFGIYQCQPQTHNSYFYFSLIISNWYTHVDGTRGRKRECVAANIYAKPISTSSFMPCVVCPQHTACVCHTVSTDWIRWNISWAVGIAMHSGGRW